MKSNTPEARMKLPSWSPLKPLMFSAAFIPSLHSSIAAGRCKVGDVATKTLADPDYFKEFKAPSQPPDIPGWEMGLKIALYVLAFLVTVCGNTLVIFVISRTRRMRSTTNILLLNLAVSDLTVAAVCMWVHLGNAVSPEWPFGNWVCKVNTFCQVVAVTSSVLTLTVISVERFMAILFPLRDCWTTGVTATIITITWLVAVLVALPHLFVRRVFEQRWKDRREVWCAEDWPQVYKDEVTCDTWEPGKVVYYSIEGIVMYVVPVVIMIVTYTLIIQHLLKRSFHGALISSTIAAQERATRKVIKMLVAVVVCFVLCWSPQQCLLLYGVFRPFLGVSGDQAPDYHAVKYTALYVAYLNSALNPILYCGFSNFRQALKEALRQRVRSKRRNKVHPVAGSGRRQAANNQGENNHHVNDNVREAASSCTSAHTHTCQQTTEPLKRSSTNATTIQAIEADDDIEDILSDACSPSPIVSTCRRRSVQPDDC